MNNEALVKLFAAGEDFIYTRRLLDRSAPPGRRKSISVTGLCDGTKPLFAAALASAPKRTVILCPDDPEAKHLADFISSAGLPCAFYPARDYNFNNITASHDFEHERLSVLYNLMTDESYTVVTTPGAALSLTLTPEKLAALTLELRRDRCVDTDGAGGKAHLRRLQTVRYGGKPRTVRRPRRDRGYPTPRAVSRLESSFSATRSTAWAISPRKASALPRKRKIR